MKCTVFLKQIHIKNREINFLRKGTLVIKDLGKPKVYIFSIYKLSRCKLYVSFFNRHFTFWFSLCLLSLPLPQFPKSGLVLWLPSWNVLLNLAFSLLKVKKTNNTLPHKGVGEL